MGHPLKAVAAPRPEAEAALVSGIQAGTSVLAFGSEALAQAVGEENWNQLMNAAVRITGIASKL